jgi:hypothetical protein
VVIEDALGRRWWHTADQLDNVDERDYPMKGGGRRKFITAINTPNPEDFIIWVKSPGMYVRKSSLGKESVYLW